MEHTKLTNRLLYVAMGISVLLGILFYAGGIGENALLIWSYALVVATTGVAIVAPILLFIKNPAKSKSTLLGIGALVVVFGLAYAVASGDVNGAIYTKFEVSESGSKQIGGLLIGTYILGILAIGVAIASGISNLFKK